MSLGIRGVNPIWSEVDLQGKLFDDTFFLFILQNTIPYEFATVYHYPDLNVPWNQPIRFLANGTLPSDIYFESDLVYRLEFRQGQSQQSPLIYEVDDYVPGSGGSTPVDTVAFASTNQITNPQFALMSLQSPTTITGTDPDPIELAPGWFLSLAGTGSVTISQVPLNDSNINPSNAPYALRLTMNAWTDGSVILRQRFYQNGMLWANKIVSTTVTALINGSPQSIMANLIDSNGSVLGNILPLTPINEEWNEYTGYAQLPESTNPNVPPAAYIDYELFLPSNIDVYLTSFQLIAQDLPIMPSFEQDSIERQIDHTYNRAYPLMPVGTIIDFAGFRVPTHFYLCDGSTRNRVRDYLLFSELTTTESVTLTSGINTFTVVSNVDYHIGMSIEGVGIPASTTITNIVDTTITISNNATATGPSIITFFAWGNGDGSTTFNLPYLLGYTKAGAGGTLFTDNINAVGLGGGSATHILTVDEMPSHNHPGSITRAPSSILNVGGAPGLDVFISGDGSGIPLTIAFQGGNQPHTIVQPTILVKMCIRYQ